MASRKGVNIYIPKHFMAVRNCMNVSVLYGLELRLCCLRFDIFLIHFELTAVRMDST